jgi:hypothetical protein
MLRPNPVTEFMRSGRGRERRRRKGLLLMLAFTLVRRVAELCRGLALVRPT